MGRFAEWPVLWVGLLLDSKKTAANSRELTAPGACVALLPRVRGAVSPRLLSHAASILCHRTKKIQYPAQRRRRTLQVPVFLVLELEVLDHDQENIDCRRWCGPVGLDFRGARRDELSPHVGRIRQRRRPGGGADRVSGRSRPRHDPGPRARGPKEHARDRQGGGRGAAARRADRRHPLAAWPRRRGNSCG